MRKLTIFIMLLCSLAFAGEALAEATVVGSFGNTETDITLPGRDGYRLCIKGFQVTADTNTDDITIYARGGDRAFVRLTSDAAIASTTMTSNLSASDSGVGTTAYVILQRSNGEYAEWETLASFSNLVPITAATDLPFYSGDYMYEVSSFMVYNNLAAAAAVVSNESGLFCGPLDSGLAFDNTDGEDFENIYGRYYRDNEDGRPVGWFEGVAAHPVALPGKKGMRIVITSVAMDANSTADGINWYTWNGLQTSKTNFTADIAAGQTAMIVRSNPGFASTSGFFIAERANGDYAEIQAFSNYVTTTITATALQYAFKEDDLLYEAELYGPEWANQLDTDHEISNEYGLLVGPVGQGLGMVLDNASSLIRWVTGFYEDASKPRRSLAASSPDRRDSAQVIGSHLALPGFKGKRTCLTSIEIDPTTDTTDSVYYYVAVQPFDSATLTADVAATGTSLTMTSDQGTANIATTALVVLQHPSGSYAELGLLSASSETTATIAALSAPFPDGSKMFEMVTNVGAYTLTTMEGTAAVTINDPDGFFCGPVGSPVAVAVDGASSHIDYLTGYAE